VERLIGSVRRECLDRLLIFGEAHLRQILSSYAAYYNQVRTHLALGKDAPLGRAIQRSGVIVAIPILSGLHHHYVRIWFSERTPWMNPSIVDASNWKPAGGVVGNVIVAMCWFSSTFQVGSSIALPSKLHRLSWANNARALASGAACCATPRPARQQQYHGSERNGEVDAILREVGFHSAAQHNWCMAKKPVRETRLGNIPYQRNAAAILGRIAAPDADSAIKKWIEAYGITDPEQQQLLVARPVKWSAIEPALGDLVHSVAHLVVLIGEFASGLGASASRDADRRLSGLRLGP
jgi:hypothetical protein